VALGDYVRGRRGRAVGVAELEHATDQRGDPELVQEGLPASGEGRGRDHLVAGLPEPDRADVGTAAVERGDAASLPRRLHRHLHPAFDAVAVAAGVLRDGLAGDLDPAPGDPAVRLGGALAELDHDAVGPVRGGDALIGAGDLRRGGLGQGDERGKGCDQQQAAG
jgi:hypothetical protein